MTVTSGNVSPGNTALTLWNQQRPQAVMAQKPLKGMQTLAASSAGPTAQSGSSAGSGSSVSASDFLQLLVSELQNQDPTQPTDPNQYVQQLVGVNSLQQLIQINQTLSGSSSTSTSSQLAPDAKTAVI